MDFCFDYYNAADPELQVQEYLKGNERGMIENVTPGGGRINFLMPCIRPRFTVTRGTDVARQHVSTAQMALDTVVMLPDDKVLTVIWRAFVAPCIPDDNDVEEVRIEYEQLPLPEVLQ